MILKVCEHLNFHSLLQLILTSHRLERVIANSHMFHRKRLQHLSIFAKYAKIHSIDAKTASTQLAEFTMKPIEKLLTSITETNLNYLYIISTPRLLARYLKHHADQTHKDIIKMMRRHPEIYPDLLTNPVYQHYLLRENGIALALSFAMRCRITARIILQTDALWHEVEQLTLTNDCLNVVAFTRKHQCAIDLLAAVNNRNFSQTHSSIMADVRTNLLEKLNPTNEAPYNPFLESGICLSV